MALKDWTKIFEQEELIVYENKYSKDKIATGVDNYKKRSWGVVLELNKIKVFVLRDKSKKQALAFAKNYMRSH